MSCSRPKACLGRRVQPCRATAAAAAMAAAGFLAACPDMAAAVASGGGGGRGGGGGGGAHGGNPFDTVIVIDAGSSGCRLNIYQVEEEEQYTNISGVPGGKIEPGLSYFADTPAEAANHIRPLLVKATALVPTEKHASTKVFIKSTAGMRLLPEEAQEAIYDEIYSALAGDSLFTFALERGQLGTIGGDMEAFYAVLSANYLEGRIDARLESTRHRGGAIGALDMGGASTQIIFRPSGEQEGESEMDHPRDLSQEAVVDEEAKPSSKISPRDFWSASHLGFGVAEVRTRVWDVLVEAHRDGNAVQDHSGEKHESIVENPCSFVNRIDVWEGFRLVGTGDHDSCEEVVKAALWRDNDPSCGRGSQQQPCGIGGVSMPLPKGEFVAMSVFFYALHCLHELGPSRLASWPRPSLSELREATQEFCAMDWDIMMHVDVKMGKTQASHQFTQSMDGLAHRCVETVYITTLLRDGYGFPEHSRNVTYALESNGMEVEWTLGYALAELAHGQREPGEDRRAENHGTDKAASVALDHEDDIRTAGKAPSIVVASAASGDPFGVGIALSNEYRGDEEGEPASELHRVHREGSSPSGFRRHPNDDIPDDNHTDSGAAAFPPSYRSTRRRRRGYQQGNELSSSTWLLWCDEGGTCRCEGSKAGPRHEKDGDETWSCRRIKEADTNPAGIMEGFRVDEASAAAARAPPDGTVHGENSKPDAVTGYTLSVAGFVEGTRDLFNLATLLAVPSSIWWRSPYDHVASATRKKGCDDLQNSKTGDDVWTLVGEWASEIAKWTGFAMFDGRD